MSSLVLFFVCLVSPLLVWLNDDSSGNKTGWQSGYQISQWLRADEEQNLYNDGEPAQDAVAVSVLSLAALVLGFMRLQPRRPAGVLILAPVVLGVLLALIGVLEIAYINSYEDSGLRPAVGLFVLIGSGVLAALLGLIALGPEMKLSPTVAAPSPVD